MALIRDATKVTFCRPVVGTFIQNQKKRSVLRANVRYGVLLRSSLLRFCFFVIELFACSRALKAVF